jgi:hypothetical protein
MKGETSAMIDEETRARMLRERPYSISQLRAYLRCPKSYELQYLADPRTSLQGMGAVVWFGGLMQKIIQYTYYGFSLNEAHAQVWQQECQAIYEILQEWYQLDCRYLQSGNANTNARKNWLREHPEYQELTTLLATYQSEELAQWDWKERFPLWVYFRWASTFARKVPLEQVQIPGTILVEGIPLDEPAPPLFSSTNGHKAYRVLHGVCGEQDEVHVVGVPDEFGIDQSGVAWICDNKVTTSMLSPEEVAEDAQLATYYVLLVQNHWIAEGQPTYVGHKYIREDGVVPVWADTSRYNDLVLPQLHEQFSALKAANRFLRVRGVQPSAFSPCRTCGVAHACLSHPGTRRAFDSQDMQEEEIIE